MYHLFHNYMWKVVRIAKTSDITLVGDTYFLPPLYMLKDNLKIIFSILSLVTKTSYEKHLRRWWYRYAMIMLNNDSTMIFSNWTASNWNESKQLFSPSRLSVHVSVRLLVTLQRYNMLLAPEAPSAFSRALPNLECIHEADNFLVCT